MPALTPFSVNPGHCSLQPIPDDSLRVLLTGYGPFFRYRENASWLAVRSLNNTYLQVETSHSLDRMVEDDTIPKYTNGHSQTYTQLIHITSLQLPLTYQAILDIVPGFHTRPPTLPPGDPANPLADPPEQGYDFIFHIGLAGRGPLRMERLGHKIGYRMKDTTGEHAPVVDYLPDASTAAGHEASQAEILENVQLLGSSRLSSSMGDTTNPADVTVEVPVRGFGKGYEGFADDFYTAIDVERLVHDLKHSGIEHVYSSLDAGHYVCDFTYYCSLAEAKRTATKHDKGKHTKVLFMHCPPVDQPLSLAEVTEAVQKIILWVCKGGRR
ncbi:peptidase C15, pyroglutamyl peptidase I-like protein [Dentipellis sp. KUC8613]|nr:peptidase C15, pyroglutamyl peptidase I-like protein [Dentipellis sp. KUC8613]